jgi:hypothetical protein
VVSMSTDLGKGGLNDGVEFLRDGEVINSEGFLHNVDHRLILLANNLKKCGVRRGRVVCSGACEVGAGRCMCGRIWWVHVCVVESDRDRGKINRLADPGLQGAGKAPNGWASGQVGGPSDQLP